MSMDRWNPFREIGNMRQAVDRWRDDRFNNSWPDPSAQANALSVTLDIHETEAGYELEASLPGIKPEDVDIQVDRETVTLRGTTVSNEQAEEGRNYIYRERRSGNFFRTVRLPEAIDAEKVEATLDHGILKVQLPKLAQAQKHRVQVRSTTQGSLNKASAPKASQTQNQSNEAVAANSDNDGGPVVNTENGGKSS